MSGNNLVDLVVPSGSCEREALQNAPTERRTRYLTHPRESPEICHYDDLIETWRRRKLEPRLGSLMTEKTGRESTKFRAASNPVQTIKISRNESRSEYHPPNNMGVGKGRKLPGGGSTSRRRGPRAFPNAISREELDRDIEGKKNQRGRVVNEANQRSAAKRGLFGCIEG
ncbi:hypothetical protein Tco_1067352 [Tanacetum coccineum]|uniref:Uncharacterized protein n=1 Tax=Tanacetum coccineum TaxID=301880 RepID=A0ABQ5HEF3_9ASTR